MKIFFMKINQSTVAGNSQDNKFAVFLYFTFVEGYKSCKYNKKTNGKQCLRYSPA